MDLSSNKIPENLNRFAATNKRLGLDPLEQTHNVLAMAKSAGKEKVTVYSADPAISDIPPKIVTVNTIADMKEKLGFNQVQPDLMKSASAPRSFASLDKLLEAAPKIAKSQKTPEFNAQQRADLVKAAHDVLMHHSKSGSKYEALINQAHFPQKMGVFSSPETHTVEGTVVIKPAPDGSTVVWNYPEVVMAPQAKILQQANFQIDTDILKSGAGPSGDLPINNTPPPYDSPARAGGTSDPPGQTGSGTPGVARANNSKKGCPIECVTPPGNGDPGAKGADGGEGSPGSPGLAMSSLIITVNEQLTGKIIIQAGGGNGQDGGDGGKGANGGPGGPPGPCPKQCTAANQGSQGPGGRGGQGGNGGNGGDVGIITIKIPFDMAQPPVDLIPVGGRPGNNGNPGNGGSPGGKPGPTNTHIPQPSAAPKVVFQRLPPTP